MSTTTTTTTRATMTRQHFEIIAAMIRETADAYRSNTAHARAAAYAAAMLAETNPRFDRARFILAAMPRHHVGTCHANVWERAARGQLSAAQPRRAA